MRFARLALPARFTRVARVALVPVLAASLAGCGDDPPAPAKGAFAATFEDPGTDCAVTGHNTVVGVVTDTTRPSLVENGTSDAEVKCKITGGTVAGEILQTAKFLQVQVSGLSSSSTIDNPAKGQVAYKGAEKTAETYATKDVACNFYFTNDKQFLKENSVFVAFDCPTIYAELSICKLATSYITFEGCELPEED